MESNNKIEEKKSRKESFLTNEFKDQKFRSAVILLLFNAFGLVGSLLGLSLFNSIYTAMFASVFVVSIIIMVALLWYLNQRMKWLNNPD